MLDITTDTPSEDLPDYWHAEEVKEIAQPIINEYHSPRLAQAGIVYLFRKKMKHAGLASARGSKDRMIHEIMGAECDFVITIDWATWISMEEDQREALIDHELTHCVYKDRRGELVPAVRDHDLEEFREIVERHGMWNANVSAMNKVMRRTTKPGGGDRDGE